MHQLGARCMLTAAVAVLASIASFAQGIGETLPVSQPSAAATSRPGVADTSAAELAFVEAVYAEQMLRDPAAAAPLYRRIVEDGRAPLGDRQRATVRLARCQRLMNRPDAAANLLNELLRSETLPPDVRAEATLEMKQMPAVAPSRLMPDDTLVYAELREPARMLKEVADLLTRAEVDEIFRARILGWLRQAFRTDMSKLLNRSMLAQLAQIEGVGLGLHNVGFETVNGQPELRADVLFVVYTGDIVASALAFPWVLAGVLKADVVLDGVQFYTPGSAAPDFHFAFEEGLLVLCSDMRAGADAVLRHLGHRRRETLFGVPEFQQRPAGMDAADTFGFYVSWPRLVDLAVRQAPDAEREDVDILVDMLALRQIGPIFGSLSIDGDRGEVELAANVLSTDALMYRLCHTPPLEPGWRRWIPENALFGVATGVTPGDRRWRDFETFLYEMARAQRLTRTAQSASRPAGDDPLAGYRRFEEAAQISIAEDVFRGINGVGFVVLDAEARPSGDESMPSIVMVLDVDQADVWRRRIERGLRRWLYGALSDSSLPTKAVETPVGTVELLSLPRTRIGLAWQVEGRRVVVALGLDTIVSYLQRLKDEQRAATSSRRGQTENKFVSLRIDELLRLYYAATNRPAGPRSALSERSPPLIVRTYERDDRVRIVVEQDELAAALRAVIDVELSRP